MTAISNPLRSNCAHLKHHNISSTRFTSNLASLFTFNQNPKPHHPQNQTEPITISHTQTQQDSLLSLIKSCSHKSHILQIHAHILRTSLILDSTLCFHFLSLISLSPQFKNLTYSRHFLAQILKPNPIHYNTLVRGYSMSDSPDEGFRLYRDFRRRGLPCNSLSSFFVIQCCVRTKYLLGGVQIHGRVVRDGHQSDSRLLTTLMDLYSMCGRYNDACKVFDEIPLRDTVAWNVLISCFLHNSRSRDALGLFDVMQSESYGCEPDDVTCLLTLQACANMNALELGERVHRYIEGRGYGDATNLCNALLTMYSRCGCLDKAYEVFKGMPGRNVVSWSAMISGLAVNGYGRDAVDAFCEMQRLGVLPDEQTFTGVLSACSHCGLVDEAMDIFDRMSREFGVVPNVHHYGCIVDLLGRAGRLDQAYQLIMAMDVKPDPKIWRTLLGACRIHKYETLGERVVDHLIELKAQEAGDYVLLMNIYSTAENWEKLAKLRKFMKEKSIQTTPGCSTIILNGTVHEFLVDDVLHPRKDEIYRMLDEINSQLKIAGYVADVSSEMHNLGTEEKGCALSYHSEKLAIAFGVLATPPGTTVRVAKNLRTCVDCHNFAMLLSGVYNRTIIVRDRSRFHHFREGRCSCNGYW
ncbi:pentatricopeptide repeat-containing protein At3g47530 [Argentina anserina]|uniref:pentatricopeptide repeat-containing protein At3g47530 n=1 Tax=Argentina anserina TaxID=57926 RepID=UPI0021762581|nr:pentatricopeptide repeat-containing protein At3g47530 [Potentilla anserina]